MPWYVVTIGNPKPGSSGVAQASIQFFTNTAAYTRTVGASPTQVDSHQPMNGYATRALAQHEADRWNGQPKQQKQFGTLPDPNIDNMLPGVNLDIFKGLNLGSILLRIGEVLLGIVLIGVGVARITGLQNTVSQVVKTKLPIPV